MIEDFPKDWQKYLSLHTTTSNEVSLFSDDMPVIPLVYVKRLIDHYFLSPDANREDRICAGDVVVHFKRETVSNKNSTLYLYRVLDTNAKHTETGERCVVYKALYKNPGESDYRTYIRPYDMFMSEVDHEKYPNIKQKYRLEVFYHDSSFKLP